MFKSFYQELSRRNVLRVGIAYLAAAWLLIQISEVLFPVFDLDEKILRTLVIVIAIGFVPALVLSWVFQFTPKGLVVDTDEPETADIVEGGAGSQSRPFDRIVLVVLALAVTFFAVDKFILTPDSVVEQEDQITQQLAAFPAASIAVLPFVNMSNDRNNEYFFRRPDRYTPAYVGKGQKPPGICTNFIFCI